MSGEHLEAEMSIGKSIRNASFCAALGCCSPVLDAAVVVSIAGDVATAEISLDDGLGETYLATMILTFQQPQNLTEACLGISAQLLDAAGILQTESRFPGASAFAIDTDFPMRVLVEPPVACGLGFSNDVVIELTTPELDFVAQSPYRLLKAPVGSGFADITEALESGSVRARGRGGTFSEFVIAEDLLQNYALDAEFLFGRLEDEIADPDISFSARATLQLDLAVAEAAYREGQFGSARDALDTLESDLRAFAGTSVPNRWRSAQDLLDEVGELLGLARALRFELARLDGLP